MPGEKVVELVFPVGCLLIHLVFSCRGFPIATERH